MSQLYHLNREIEQLKKQKENLEYTIQAISATKDTVQGSSASFPFVLHSITVEGIPHSRGGEWLKMKSELQDVKKLLEINAEKLVFEYNRLNRYIQECEDSLTRQVLTGRYINGLSWPQVAAGIEGNNTEDSVKKIAYRYFKKDKRCPTCPEK